MEKTLRLDWGQIEVVDDAIAEVLRHKTQAERIRIGFNIWISARDMLRDMQNTKTPFIMPSYFKMVGIKDECVDTEYGILVFVYSLTTYLKKIHPEWDNEKLALEVARRLSHGSF